MFPLRCTVRRCERPLRPASDGLANDGLTCDAGHHFDRAKQGYWNLLQPQDRKSKHPGDSDEAVMARHRWLQRGHMRGLSDSVRPWLDRLRGMPHDQPAMTLDLGCGEGAFASWLFDENHDRLGAADYCGIDLSKRAVRLAARQLPAATWVLANADRGLPAHDGSVSLVVSFFGRRPAAEIRRVLRPDGHCLFTVPGPDDLVELREAIQMRRSERSRWEEAAKSFRQVGMTLVDHLVWRTRVSLDAEALSDALAMTYRGVRHSQQARLSGMTSLDVTLSADVVLMRCAIIEKKS